MPESSLERGLAVLRQFDRDRSRMGATEIGAALGIPRSSLHRLLTEMVALNLLQRDRDGRYALAAGVLLLGHEYLASQDIVLLGQPVLEALSATTGWTTHLAVRQGTSIIYLVRCLGKGAITENVSVGTSLPAHATLMGRLLLTGLSEADLAALYDGYVFNDRGNEVPSSLQALVRQLDLDRKAACLTSDGYYETGLAAVAAPVRDRSAHLSAAINATRAGATAVEAERVRAAVLEAANTISALIGGSPVSPNISNGEHKWPSTTVA